MSDRFIQIANSTTFSLPARTTDELAPYTASDAYADSLSQALWSANPRDSKILHPKTPAPVTASTGGTMASGSSKRIGTQVHKQRKLPTLPEKVLDLPGLTDDYYTNTIDWSCNNQLAVGLGTSCYLFNATTSSIAFLTEASASIDCVKFSECGTYASVTAATTIEIYDATASDSSPPLRSMGGHTDRICTTSWYNHLVASGSRDRTILLHDVRCQQHVVATLVGHQGEVCNVSWNENYLASGSNDNEVRIHDVRDTSKALHVLTKHTAAVKALAWCPHQRNLLASGGGSADRTVRFWNAASGSCVGTIETEAQVTSLLWSKDRMEVITAHGFSTNSICLFDYASMSPTGRLLGHTARVLHLAMSPLGDVVASAGADETLRFWRIGSATAAKKTSKPTASSATRSKKLAAVSLK